MGIVVEGRCVVEQYPHTEMGELVEDEDLIDVDARQTIGRQAPHGFERAGFGLIAQRVESGTIKTRARKAVVAKLADELMPFGRDARSQDFELRADRAACLLRLARYSGVERYFHWATSCVWFLCWSFALASSSR